MLLKKKGFPEEGELLFCTVTNVQYNSVFVRIEEYDKSGLVHISEISPGRIRNIRDFVKEGKMIVCKVIKVDEQRGHIDLSLRRVTEMQKRQKTDERKQEQKAEKIIETLAFQQKKPVQQVYDEVSAKLIPKYGLLQYAFEDCVENNATLLSLGVPEEFAKPLEALVKEKIKPKKVVIGGTITIKNWSDKGVEVVKEALIAGKKVSSHIDIRYLGAGNYSIMIDAKDYKEAEKTLKDSLDAIEKHVKENKGTEFSFKKKEKD